MQLQCVRVGWIVALTDTSTAELFRSRRHQNAADRAFALRRIELVRECREDPLKRVASLFAVLSRNNTYEGRDPTVIAESMRCGVLADYLNMTLDELTSVLVDLQRRGLIEPDSGGGVRLNSIADLESLADA